MALSPAVKNELLTLQTYYKNLYFLRWFLPTELTAQLNTLAQTDLDSVTSQDAAVWLIQFYHAATADWYSQLILFLLSGFRQFIATDVMKQMQTLHPHELDNAASLAVVLESSDLASSVIALLELKQVGITCVTHPQITAEKLAGVIKIKHCNLRDDWKALFYLSLVVSTRPNEVWIGIELLQAEPLCAGYIPKLANSPAPNELAIAFNSLAQQSLLPSEDELVMPTPVTTDFMDSAQQHLQLKTHIFNSILRHTQPSAVVDAVRTLAAKNLLERLTFNELLISDNPNDLALLMISFGNRLDQSTLVRLESHRKNKAYIESRMPLTETKKTHIDYCENFVVWLQQAEQPPCSHLITLYDAYEENLRKTKHFSDFVAVLCLLNNPSIWQTHGDKYVSFLTSYANSPEKFLVYARILAVSHHAVTVHNCERLLKRLAECNNPNELLKKCQTRSTCTAVLLDQWIKEINQPAVASTTTLSVPVKRPSTGTTLFATKHVDDLGGRLFNDSAVAVYLTPAVSDLTLQGRASKFAGNIWGNVVNAISPGTKTPKEEGDSSLTSTFV